MRPFLSNAHTHSTFCDGKNTPLEMIAAAKELGFVSLGFSGHASPGFESAWCMPAQRHPQYMQAIRDLQPSTQGVRIWCGYEVDAMTPAELLSETREADYRIGSMHYFVARAKAPQADGRPETLRQYLDETFAGDGLALARRYYDILAEFVNREHPDIIGHFDLIRKNAQKIQLFDETSPAYRKIALDALERIFPSGSVLEVNTGGVSRGYLPTPYPTLELLCAWREMGGRVTVTSDCHDCNLLNCAFDQAMNLIHQAGFQSVLRLGTGDRLWDEIEVE